MPFDKYLLFKHLKEKMNDPTTNNSTYAEIYEYCMAMEHNRDQYFEMHNMWKDGWRPGKGYPKEN